MTVDRVTALAPAVAIVALGRAELLCSIDDVVEVIDARLKGLYQLVRS